MRVLNQPHTHTFHLQVDEDGDIYLLDAMSDKPMSRDGGDDAIYTMTEDIGNLDGHEGHGKYKLTVECLRSKNEWDKMNVHTPEG